MTAPRGVTFRDFIAQFVRVVDERTRRLVALTLHAEQDRFVSAIDARDPTTGLRVFLTYLLSLIKKAGKSTLLEALALWALTCDDLAGSDREVIVASSDLLQSKDIIFLGACRMVQRNVWLRQRCKIAATEITYREQVRDDATGGQYTQVHVLRAVPRDPRGLTGLSPSCLIIDEAWTADDYDLVEALTPPPSRRSPIAVFGSYAGLKSQQRRGVPWFDLLERAKAGSDPTLFLAHLSGPEAWKEVPWITPRWIAQMRRLYETCPSRYIRMIENRPAPSDSGFLTLEEVQAAIDPALSEPAHGTPGVQYVAALDVGLVHDASALVIGHVSADSKFTVDVVRLWQGTRAAPVSLTNLEAEVSALARRFKLRTLVIDQWQAVALAEQFKHRGLPAQLVTIEPTRLDRLTTLMKGSFARREVRLPASAHDLIEQLESLDVRESGARNRRRDLLRFDSGTGPGVASHDDAAICLALCLEAAAGEIGRPVMAEVRRCLAADYIANAQGPIDCPLSGGASPHSGCRRCPAYESVVRAIERHAEQTGERLSVQSMSRRMKRCALVRELQWARTSENLLSWL
jgi:hypothetical protein